MNQLLNDLVAVSREYGSDPRWVVAGGGNTSLKDGDVLYIKASGFPLATIDLDGFARMDREKLAAIWETDYPVGDDPATVAERERLVLADMMNARVPEEQRRPSVETLLHDLLPWPLVVHLHPTLVNGLTCGSRGEEIAAELFGDGQVWIPVTDPGYVLAKVIKEALEERESRGLSAPEFIFLANHGVFAGGKDAKEIREKYDRLQRTLSSRMTRSPEAMPEEAPLPWDSAAWDSMTREYYGDQASWTYVTGGELDRYTGTNAEAKPLTGSLTPDHIVYAGPGAAFIPSGDISQWKTVVEAYIAEWGKAPNLLLVSAGEDTRGAVVVARGEKSLANALLLLTNALEVCAYAESFGGPLILEERFVRFIVNWEVENYRSALASG